MISSRVSAVLNNRSFLFIFCLLVAGCGRAYHVKYNLAEGEVTDLAIIRKPAPVKSWGIFPVYEDVLEGNIRGGLFDAESRPIQGVSVKVLDEKGKEAEEFVPGITDNSGIFKVRFSLPIRWKRIDFTGYFSCENWKIINPKPKFYIYFNRDTGVFAYSMKETWLAIKSEQGMPLPIPSLKPTSASPPAQEKKKDFFEDFGFGP